MAIRCEFRTEGNWSLVTTREVAVKLTSVSLPVEGNSLAGFRLIVDLKIHLGLE
jgi:hypothetical protein